MNILLVGEYNSSHKSLKEGLINLGHNAKVVGLTDGFKDVEVDILIKHRYRKGILKKCRTLFFKIFKIDIYALDIKKQIKQLKPHLTGHDVIQYINEAPFICPPDTEKEIFDLLLKWNNKAFLLSCGTDYPSVKYAFDRRFRYSILTPYFENRIPETSFSLGLKYIRPDFKKLHDHIYSKIHGVISSDLDYTIPLKDHKKHLGLIPHVINTDLIKYQPLVFDKKIIIFHGINRSNYFKKGNDLFESALFILKESYSSKIEIITVENAPYSTYINSFNRAHILLDQVYSYDQGYNALEAMAKGKVVFTGAEQEWLDYFNIEEDTIAINALPNVEDIVKKIENLILNPHLIIEISKNARAFVEKEHGYLKCAQKFINTWKAN